jgi:hypothetical protein
MDLFFSTIVRNSSPHEGGEVVRLNWDNKAVLARTPIYARDPELTDPNPRGNTRGGRGIALWGDKIVVASYHTLTFYDWSLRPQGSLSHPLMVNLHEICPGDEEDRLWLASTAIDAAVEIDLLSGEATHSYWPREMKTLQQALGLTPLEIDKSIDNRGRYLTRALVRHPSHVHLNALAVWRGELFGLFNAFGVIANLTRGEIAIEHPRLKGAHNLMVLQDGTAIVNGTVDQTVRFYDLNTGQAGLVIALDQMEWVRDMARPIWRAYRPKKHLSTLLRRTGVSLRLEKATDLWSRAQRPAYAGALARMVWPAQPLFVRGMDLHGDQLFVGLSPAAILAIDRHSGRLLDAYRYSDDVHNCVHGLKVVAG